MTNEEKIIYGRTMEEMYEPVCSDNRVYSCDGCGCLVEVSGILSGDDMVLCDDCIILSD